MNDTYWLGEDLFPTDDISFAAVFQDRALAELEAAAVEGELEEVTCH